MFRQRAISEAKFRRISRFVDRVNDSTSIEGPQSAHMAQDSDDLTNLNGGTRTVLSDDPMAMRRPSPLTATLHTGPSCPCRQSRSWPLAASHTRTVLSDDPMAMRRPSPLTATLHTGLTCRRRQSRS